MVFHIYSPPSEGRRVNRYAQVLLPSSRSLFSTRIAHKLPRLMTLRAMVAVLLGEEELLSDAVSGKRNRRNAEAREGALEAVKPGEGTCVSPLLAVRW